MKNFAHVCLFLAGLIALNSCKTNDVIGEWEDPDTNKTYEITDKAFGEYLIYNASLAETEDNKLPSGIAFEKDGKTYIDKEVAATVTYLYLVKDNNRMEDLEKAGVTTAREKIAGLDGIQLFTELKEIKLTSNALTGTLDLSMLTKLETLEMNSNFVNELIVPPSLTRLRYAASTSDSAPDNRWLISIDLSQNPTINHIHLPNHHLTKDGFKLPGTFSELTYINVSGNTDAPFEIPADLYNQLTTKEGVIAGNSNPEPEDDKYILNDKAFGEYLIHNSKLEAGDGNKLPEGIAFESDGNIILDKKIAVTVNILYLVKDNARMKELEAAGVQTANQKIASLDGIQFFTNVTEIKLTSNQLTGKLDLSMLTKLTTLEMNSNFVNELIVPPSLTRLRYAASTSDSAPDNRWLISIDLSKNPTINHIHLPNHHLTKDGFKLPGTFSELTYINVSGNTDAPFTIPAALFGQLETKDGVISE